MVNDQAGRPQRLARGGLSMPGEEGGPPIGVSADPFLDARSDNASAAPTAQSSRRKPKVARKRTTALTDKQRRFVEEFIVDLNATQAAIRAGYSRDTARSIGHELLTKHEVQTALAAAQAARSERTAITADKVLQHWWAIATADANDISQHRRVNCRHCWGVDFGFQWREGEYQLACDEAVKAERPRPEEAGGLGYDPTRPAHPDCPACAGEGVGDVHFVDTRRLTGAARLLYAGVKKTKDGLELKTRDQDKAMENVARHLGMFVDKAEVEMKHGFSDISDEELLKEIAHLTAAMTPKGRSSG